MIENVVSCCITDYFDRRLRVLLWISTRVTSNAAVAALLSQVCPNVNELKSTNFNFNNEHPYEPYLDPLDVEPQYLAQGGSVDFNKFPNTTASCSSLSTRVFL